MMRRGLLVAALTAFLQVCVSAQILKGIILENDRNGHPVSNVRITEDASGATLTFSETDGTFVLRFPDRKPGQRVFIRAFKKGYGVVGDFPITVRLLLNPDEDPTPIYLCKLALCDETNARLRSLRLSTPQIPRGWGDPLGSLSVTSRAETGSEKNTQKEFNSREAEQLRDDLAAAGQIAAIAQKEIEQIAKSWSQKADVLATQRHIEEAEQAYQAALQIMPTSFSVNLAFANFNKDQSRYAAATKAFEKSLEIAQQATDPAEIADALSGLGELQFKENLIDEAGLTYNKALPIYRELAQKKPGVYLLKVAIALGWLGTVQLTQNRMDEGRKSYEEAIRIISDVSRKEPECIFLKVTLQAALARGVLNDDTMTESARQAFAEAAETYQNLAQKDRDKYFSYLQLTLFLQGMIALDDDQNEDAGKVFAKMLQACDSLTNGTSDFYECVSLAKIGLAAVESNEDHSDSALKHAGESLQAISQMKHNLYYDRELKGAILSAIGDEHRGAKHNDEALKAYAAALEIFHELAQQNPETPYAPEAGVLHDLCAIHDDLNWVRDAQENCENSLKIYRELVRRNPYNYPPEMADTLKLLATQYKAQNRKDDARRDYQEALDIYKRFAAQDADKYQKKAEEVQGLLDALNKPPASDKPAQ
jgi:tetratricopeptide (TPR) repeat protein